MVNRIKKISCEMSLSRSVKGEEHTSKYHADMELSADSSIREIADFIGGMKKIWSKAINMKREAEKTFNPPAFFMEITEHVMDRSENWTTNSFNRWYTYDIDDICTGKGEESIYLRPDTKYTSETRDMSIGKDVLRDLAFTMG